MPRFIHILLSLSGLFVFVTGSWLTSVRRDPSGAYWLLADATGESSNQRTFSLMLPDGVVHRDLQHVFGNFLMWTPDGSGMLFLGRQGIYRSDFDGSGFALTVPANGDAYFINPVQLDVSYDGKHILAKVPRTRKTSNLHLLSASGQPIKQLPIDNRIEITSAIWHDDQTIEYTVRESSDFSIHRMDITDLVSYAIPSNVTRINDGDIVVEQLEADRVLIERSGNERLSVEIQDDDSTIVDWLGDWLVLRRTLTPQRYDYLLANVHSIKQRYSVFTSSHDDVSFASTIGDLRQFVYFTATQGSIRKLYRVDADNGFQREVILDGFQPTSIMPGTSDGILWSSSEDILIWKSLNNKQMEYKAATMDGEQSRTLYRSPGPANQLLVQFSPDRRHLYISVLDARPLLVHRRFVARIRLEDGHVETIPGDNWELKGISRAIDLPARTGWLTFAGVAILLGAFLTQRLSNIPRS